MDDIGRFVAEVERWGYANFLAAFPAHATRRDRWVREAREIDGTLRALVDLFLLGEPVSVDRLPDAVATVLPTLAQHEIVESDGDTARSPLVCLLRPLGVWLFAEPHGGYVVERYFAPDSVALALHATYRVGTRCLDLCAGPGFQALVAARRCAEVTLVELQPRAARLAGLNAVLNDVADRLRVHTGDLYGPLDPGVRYEHIVANVPVMPVPPGLPFPAVGAGGADGFDLGRRVLDGLPDRLLDGGSAHLFALLLRAGRELAAAEELAAWARRAGCGVIVTATADMPVDRDSMLVQSTAAAIVDNGYDGDATRVADEVAQLYSARGATGATWAFLRVDAGGSGLRMIDLGRPGRRSPWVSLV